MKKLSALLLFGVLSLSAMSAARAADKGLYLGVSGGEADTSISASSVNASFSGKDFAYKGIVGLRFLDWLAVEANYVDLGKPDSAQLKADSNGISGFMVGYKDLGPVDVFAKLGAIDWKARISSNGVHTSSHDGTDIAYGAGVQVSVLLFKVRAEYERFEVDRGANLLSVGLIWTFL